jgi:uncharacterized DUF497 family protein
MRSEWDPQKQRSNLKKHGIEFADAAAVLDDALAVTIYTWRGNTARLISARRATPRERRQYEGKE